VTLHFQGPILRESAQFDLAADLSRQSVVECGGMLKGHAEFVPTEGKFPLVRFELAGTGVGNSNLVANNFKVLGSFDSPVLELTRIAAEFDDGSRIVAGAKLDLPSRQIAGGHCSFAGTLARRWLPAGYGFENSSISVSFHGPLTNLTHSGNLELTGVTSPRSTPLRLRAEWAGEQLRFQQTQIETASSNATVLLRGSLEISNRAVNIALRTLTVSSNKQPMLELANPCAISFVPGTKGNDWRLVVAPFDWVGPAGEIHAQANLAWPQAGKVYAELKNLNSAMLVPFLKEEVSDVDIHSARAYANWSNGPAEFGFKASADVLPKGDLPLSADIDLFGNASGISVSNLVVNSTTSSVAVARGFLPLAIRPDLPTNNLQLDLNKELNFTAYTQPESVLWAKLASLTGVELNQPDLHLNIAGTWKSPRGELAFRAAQIHFHKTNAPLPALDQLELGVQFDRARARISKGHMLVQGQGVELVGEIPLGESFWADVREKKPPNWEKASAKLQIANAQLSAFQPLFPTILSPQDTLDLDASLQPGGKLEGTLLIQQARTRPLPGIGTVRDISLGLRFHERTLRLDEGSAIVGGSLVLLAGEVDLHSTEWLKGIVPPFAFSITGKNIPLSRQPESIIRSDLALTITKSNTAPALITGSANLQNSYFLSDLTVLIPGKVATVSHRPPYFSIDDPAIANWRLAVHVSGERFLRVRAPLFTGVASANLNLTGTLKEPFATGDVRINSGVVGFPFADFQVQQGFVTLSSANPYHPQLSVSATAKELNYDLRMEVSGDVEGPVIQFSSTPPLSSEQVLLMVTAGQMPTQGQVYSTGQRAQTLGLFVGKDLLAKLGIGDQSQQRLTIRSGEEVSEQGKPTYTVEYKLTDKWSLVGEYDRFNAYNAGVKWRVYSK